MGEGESGSALAFEIPSKRIQDRPRHTLGIPHYVRIRKPDDSPTIAFEKGGAGSVFLLPPHVRVAIQFDSEPCATSSEINMI